MNPKLQIIDPNQRCFTVDFAEFERWSVSHFRCIDWQWPTETIRRIGTVLQRSLVPVDEYPENSPIIGKISFGGGLSLLSHEKRIGYQGRLFRAEAGQFIYSKIRAKQGSLCIIPSEVDWVAVSSEYPVYDVLSESTDSTYFELLIGSELFKHYLDGISHGSSTKTRIHPDQFENILIPIPPIDEQRRIAEHWHSAKRSLLEANDLLDCLVAKLNLTLRSLTFDFDRISQSKMFIADFEYLNQWDTKGGRAAAFITAYPDFVRLGDFTEEGVECVRAGDEPEKEWPIYGVNNKTGVFLSTMQLGKDFNMPYKKIEKDYFFHNPTRANVGSIGIVGDVPEDAITSPEYQVWKLTGGFLPDFMALLVRTKYFLALVAFNRVGGVKQRMYYANLAEIRLPMIEMSVQEDFARRRTEILSKIESANTELANRKGEIEEMILGTRPVPN